MRGRIFLKLGLLGLLILGLTAGLRALGVDVTQLTPERVRAYVLSYGPIAPVIYLTVYGQPLVPLPASILTIAAGLAFGPLWGVVAAIVGATVRACGQFLIARLLGREAVARLLKGRVAALDQKIGENGFQTVLLIRLIPNLPYDVQNYGLGFSRVTFGPYTVATMLGIIPASVALVYFGHSLTDLRQLWKLGVGILLVLVVIAAQRRFAARSRSSSRLV
jgi:uncharacterized membrane protein YdjX (TVP38/TMEM64 family)